AISKKHVAAGDSPAQPSKARQPGGKGWLNAFFKLKEIYLKAARRAKQLSPGLQSWVAGRN
ncbi:MAG TPA: hypothetical protein VK555_04025, partial [Terriglobales bacterium]|nr:hypothetical protein [Terriglobales bacterium]